MCNRRLLLCFLLSLAIHLVVGLHMPTSKNTPHHEPINVSYIHRPIAMPLRNSPVKKGPRLPGLRQLSVLAHNLTASFSRVSVANTGTADSSYPNDDWGYGGGDLVGQMEHLPKFQRLFVEVQGLLYYPSKLAYHKVSGTVNLRLRFKGDSQCDLRRSKVYSGHPYLRFYALALLRKLCGLENIRHMGFNETQFVDLNFTFAIQEFQEGSREIQAKEFIVGNVLSFYRSHAASKLEFNIGPLKGYLFAPAILVDFEWIAENWDKYVNGRDPFEEFRER